ncbi:hypothetical protein C4569_02695 [Candidatus Parcubacteria bacterium]|nr:MAG: hypothetical protein C4569_02695 [Candidatus Parcubacteria bacterium]
MRKFFWSIWYQILEVFGFIPTNEEALAKAFFLVKETLIHVSAAVANKPSTMNLRLANLSLQEAISFLLSLKKRILRTKSPCL